MVSITDLQGRAIKSKTGKNNYSFPVSELSPGTYIVTVSTEKDTHIENVVIQ